MSKNAILQIIRSKAGFGIEIMKNWCSLLPTKQTAGIERNINGYQILR
jgi:hypothetical protein